MRRTVYLVALLAGSLLLAACVRIAETAHVTMDDGRISVQPETIRAGSFDTSGFEITNVGTEPHRYMIFSNLLDPPDEANTIEDVGVHYEPGDIPVYDWGNAQEDVGMGGVEWCVFMEFDYTASDPPPPEELPAIEARRAVCEEAVANVQRIADPIGVAFLTQLAGEHIAPGETVTIRSLSAARYTILCNVPGHYERGEVAVVIVTR